MSKQFEIFPSSTSMLYGVEVKIESTTARPCCSRSGIAVLGYSAGNGMHAASITCSNCGQHRGWLSRETARQVEEVIQRFGRPSEPIIIRR
jgi:hypothetical protein